MAMYLIRLLLRQSPILFQLIWVTSRMTTLSQMRLTSLQYQIYYQRIQRWKHYVRTFLAKSAVNTFLYDHRHNINLKCQTFGEHR
ncbi:hypothetical protein FOVG_19724 [Fusarium oxysporum f. sp. pisi HDV247]|uniref:Secreted protein n=1 Tax=Fusarium oxysporum f. sp. pisi HDV247 TaxID=1080344 RepID=W9NFC4_FUSOX|nr:hypothetical protein FOVG_19724 [Fusarium oxysporum f. sp. pisi HDV247]